MPHSPLKSKRFAKRKIPLQQRSRDTVENIKLAALSVITRDGFGDLGTGRIAERAGISIGSLYQYFPTCESILLALYEDVTASLAFATKQILIEILDDPLEDGVEYVIRSLLALHQQHEIVLIRLVEESPEIRLAAHPLSFGNLIRGSIRIYLQHQKPKLRNTQVERMTQFIEHVALSSIRWYLLDGHHVATETLYVADVSRMIVDYIETQALVAP